MEDRSSTFQGRADTGLVDSGELVSGATKGLESDQYPKLLCCPPGDVINMGSPAEVAGDGDAKEPRLVDHLKWVAVREV